MRVIGDDGQQIGVMATDQALRLAQERELDLVEVAPEAKPPVCRILDYSKYKYEQAQKVKAAKKHQTQITIREIKFRPKIAEHDYATKKGHVTRFLLHKDKVKITIMFRGREVTHPERGKMILDRLAEELAELAAIEQRPNLDGRNMTMVLGPSKAVIAGEFEKEAVAARAAAAAAGESDEAVEGEVGAEAADDATAVSDATAESPEAVDSADSAEPAPDADEAPASADEPADEAEVAAADEPEAAAEADEPADDAAGNADAPAGDAAPQTPAAS